jgi:hypothetical protein
VDFGGASHGGHRSHGHTRIHDIVAHLSEAGLNVVESGAVGSMDLQFALATPGSLDLKKIPAQGPDNAQARRRLWRMAEGDSDRCARRGWGSVGKAAKRRAPWAEAGVPDGTRVEPGLKRVLER